MWIFSTPSTNAEEAAHVIMDCCAVFGAKKSFMPSSTTSFRNEIMHLVLRGSKSKYHLTQAYCPLSNGVVELFGKEII